MLVLAVVAAAGLAATNRTGNAAASDPNGCPTNKSAKTAPIADIKPPARLQIAAFDVLSGPINEATNSFTLKVHVGSTCSVNIKVGQMDLSELFSVEVISVHSADGCLRCGAENWGGRPALACRSACPLSRDP